MQSRSNQQWHPTFSYLHHNIACNSRRGGVCTTMDGIFVFYVPLFPSAINPGPISFWNMRLPLRWQLYSAQLFSCSFNVSRCSSMEFYWHMKWSSCQAKTNVSVPWGMSWLRWSDHTVLICSQLCASFSNVFIRWICQWSPSYQAHTCMASLKHLMFLDHLLDLPAFHGWFANSEESGNVAPFPNVIKMWGGWS